MQLYKVKLNDNHSALPDQIANGYLGYVLADGTSKIEVYKRKEALKKAIAFGGLIEKEGRNYTTNECKVLQLSKSELSDNLIRELKDREVFLDNFDVNEHLYYGDVFGTILGEKTELKECLPHIGNTIIDNDFESELIVLSSLSSNYQYIMVI